MGLRRYILRTPYCWVTFVVLLSLLATAGLWSFFQRELDERVRVSYENALGRLAMRLRARMSAYETVLHGGVGLFRVKQQVTRADWHEYVETLRLSEIFAGIQGVGFSQYLAARGLAEHQARVRAEGYPEYFVRPVGPRAEYTSIVFLEPFSGRNLRAFGYDMFSEAVRHEAMVRARDTGKTTISGRVTLVQESDQDVQAGVLMYTPVYRPGIPLITVDDRRRALQGYVYAPFRMRDLIQGLVGTEPEGLHFELADVSPGAGPTSLYDPEARHASARPRQAVALEVGGRTWELGAFPVAGFDASVDARAPRLWLLAGLVLTALLGGITWVLVRGGERSERLVREKTAELQAREAQLRAMHDHVALGIVHLARDGRLMKANPAFCRLAGVEPEPLVLTYWRDLLHPGAIARFAAGLAELTHADQGQYSQDCLLMPPERPPRWVRLTIAMVPSVGEADAYFLGVVEDIEERRLAEEMVAAQEARMRVALDAAAVGVWDLDLHHLTLQLTEMPARLLGVEPGVLLEPLALAQSCLEPPEFAGVLEAWRRYQRSGERTFVVEAPFKTAEGAVRRLSLRGAVAETDGMGEPRRLVGTVVDVTFTRLVEERLRESEARFRAMADSASVMIWMAEASGRCVYFNREWLAFTGREMEQELGDGWFEGVHPEDFVRCRQVYREAFEAHEPYEMQYRLRHRSGQYRWLLDRGTPRWTSEGYFEGFLGSCVDITALHESHEHLSSVYAQLQTVLESLDIGVVHTRHRVMEWVNGAYCAMLGYERHELVGTSTQRLYVHDDEYERVGQEVYRQMAAQGAASIEVTLRSQAGRLLRLTMRGCPIDPADAAAGAIWLLSPAPPG